MMREGGIHRAVAATVNLVQILEFIFLRVKLETRRQIHDSVLRGIHMTLLRNIILNLSL